MIQVLRFNFDNKTLIEKAFAVRLTVFVNEQGVDPDLEIDGHDEDAMHYLLMEDESVLGTARWRETNNGIKLERFAILQEHRNRGLGAILLMEVMSDTKGMHHRIYLHAQADAVRFYERHGFRVEGDAFLEAGLEHRYMIFGPAK